ncbi:sigma-70 family RNA polymerase sigma factor [Thermoflavimicrobium dichotomicum]|uniref:RNA polymerase primary sigma factor n=1 Tax=Thermoflavimicrobium dichotomicum TaxID=46223 RepID=A0A1I3TPD6_9BACL|nr:sigma-70 family RNA polymerase sigma factor [Thermoflavimicrobium dichotomicum]SFJ71417.1 RNA polymerase primary sigma factor [Thermoflavimicrobium dichotomicum]
MNVHRSRKEWIKKLDQAFSGYQEIRLTEARELLRQIFQIEIDDETIRSYLAEKGCVVIEEEEFRSGDEPDEWEDLDDLIEAELPEVQLENQEPSGEAFSYRMNQYLLEEYQRTRNPEVLEQLVVQNMQLVKKFAGKYVTGSFFCHDLSADDLVAEGVVGLIKAIEKFDPDQSYQLSTYAYYWIRQSITRAIMDQGQAVRIPVHLYERILKIKRLEQRQLLTGSSIDKEAICWECQITADQYEEAKLAEHRFLRIHSLDAPISDETDSDLQLMDVIDNSYLTLLSEKSEEFLDPARFVEKKLEKEEIMQLLDQLPPRDREIILQRFGFIDGEAKTLAEIGCKLKLTRERIRQLEQKALKKLKRMARKKKILVS